MERFQVENLYKAAGLTDYMLRTPSDLLACHGIDYTAVKGYAGLDDIHKAMYETFLVRFFNGLGMDSKMELVPTAIHYVEDITYNGKENSSDDYFVEIKRIIKSIDKNGVKKVIHSYKENEYKELEITHQHSSNYLRIEYKQNGHSEWLHIIENGTQWY